MNKFETCRSGRLLAMLATFALIFFGITAMPGVALSSDVSGKRLQVSGSQVNLREAPRLDARLLTRYDRNTLMLALARTGDWIKVRHVATGRTGWMHGDFLEKAGTKPKTAKKPAGHRIFIYGDSLATDLFHGLKAVGPRAGYTVGRHTRGATGLVRDDNYDWYARMAGYLPADRPDIAVVTLGGNDRQDIKLAGRTLERFTDPWWHEYERRIGRFMKLIKRHTGQVYWVGLPVLRSDRMTADFRRLNAVYRRVAKKNGVTFVDIWPQFQVAGGYNAFGTGIDGNRHKLRLDDGTHFTRHGSLKLARIVLDAIRR